MNPPRPLLSIILGIYGWLQLATGIGLAIFFSRSPVAIIWMIPGLNIWLAVGAVATGLLGALFSWGLAQVVEDVAGMAHITRLHYEHVLARDGEKPEAALPSPDEGWRRTLIIRDTATLAFASVKPLRFTISIRAALRTLAGCL